MLIRCQQHENHQNLHRISLQNPEDLRMRSLSLLEPLVSWFYWLWLATTVVTLGGHQAVAVTSRTWRVLPVHF